MESPPLYIVIGSILGILSSFVLLILHFPVVANRIKSFVTWLWRWLLWRPIAIRRWRWWRQYRPSWRIANWGEVKIYHEEGRFRLEVPISLELRSRNNRYNTVVNLYGIGLDMYHAGKGWEKKPHRLSGRLINLNDSDFEIAPRDSVIAEFICETTISERPLVRNTVTCKMFNFTLAALRTPYVNLSGHMKREGNSKFKVNVVWEQEGKKGV